MVIVVAVSLLLVMVFSIGDFESMFKPTTAYRVTFGDIRGLKLNDPVLYAGVEIGRVVDVKVDPAEQGERTQVTIKLQIDSEYQLRQDANVRIGKTFTGKTSVKIKPGHGEPLPAGQVIEGESVPELSDLTAISRPIAQKIDATLQKIHDALDVLGEEERGKIKELFTSLKRFSDTLNMVGDNLAGLTKDDGSVQSTVGSIKSAADKLKQMLEGSQSDVDKLLANLREASGELKSALEGAKKGVGSADEAFKNASMTIGKLNDVIDVNAKDLQLSVANVRNATASFRAWADDVKRHPWKVVRKSKTDEPRRTIDAATQDLDKALVSLDTSRERLLMLTEAPSTAVQRHLGEIREMVESVKEAVAKIDAAGTKLKK